MRSRTLREGSVGLMILLGVGLFGLLILWLRGFNPANRSYRFVVTFPSVEGLQNGAPVRYRGVKVGNIASIRAGANAIDVEMEVSPATLRIPKDVLIQVNQSGLVGETSIDITPRQDLPTDLATAPLDTNCNTALIICNGDRLPGEVGISFIRLLGATIRFVDVLSDPNVIREFRTLVDNTAQAAAGVSTLSQEVTLLTRAFRQEVSALSASATATTVSVATAADRIGSTAGQVNELLLDNRRSLNSTLQNINLASSSLQGILQRLEPLVTDGEILQNLRLLSANAARASASLSSFSTSFSSQENLLLLQQTLESARATFQNAQKITADLDELTGDPTFRRNVRELVNGLSGLVSSTEQLERQIEVAQFLEGIAQDEAIAPAPSSEAAPTAEVLPSPLHITLLDPHYQVQLHPFSTDLLSPHQRFEEPPQHNADTTKAYRLPERVLERLPGK